MKINLLLAFLCFSSVTIAQENTETQSKIRFLDSLAKTTNLIHVYSEIGNPENGLLISGYNWEFKNGFIIFNNYYFDVNHLVWFRVVERRMSEEKVLQLYFN